MNNQQSNPFKNYSQLLYGGIAFYMILFLTVVYYLANWHSDSAGMYASIGIVVVGILVFIHIVICNLIRAIHQLNHNLNTLKDHFVPSKQTNPEEK